MKSEKVTEQIGYSGRTVRRELAKGPTLKTGNGYELVEYKGINKTERKLGSKKFRENSR